MGGGWIQEAVLRDYSAWKLGGSGAGGSATDVCASLVAAVVVGLVGWTAIAVWRNVSRPIAEIAWLAVAAMALLCVEVVMATALSLIQGSLRPGAYAKIRAPAALVRLIAAVVAVATWL